MTRSVGIALGGGAVLGTAHIGVLKAMEEAGLRSEAVSGTSIGAFIGSLHAFGMPVEEIEAIALELDWLDMTSFKLSKMGFLGNDRIGKLILDTLGRKTIEESQRPLAIVATDISTGNKVVLREGPLYKAVMASSCLPGIFIPVEWEGRLLVDGFLCDNVPVTPLREMGIDTVIASDLTSNRTLNRPDDMIDVLSNTFNIGFRNMVTRPFNEEWTIPVQPELNGYSKTDARKTRELINRGYETAKKVFADHSAFT